MDECESDGVPAKKAKSLQVSPICKYQMGGGFPYLV